MRARLIVAGALVAGGAAAAGIITLVFRLVDATGVTR